MAPTVVANTGGYELETRLPREGVFEIALVMAGAVSAGAYTAGVLDYLVEALDAWQTEKEKRRAQNPDPKTWDIPGHDVHLRVVSGASAGSMCGAIASVAFKYQFPHVHVAADGAKNPLYKPWVIDIDIAKLLQTRDLEDEDALVVSLLDSTSLLEILQVAIDFQGAKQAERLWIAGGVRFIFTQSNLRGIPYFLQLTGSTVTGLAMIGHSDYQSFSVTYNLTGTLVPKADDTLVTFPNNFGNPAWHKLGYGAVASGAFPVGLAPRVIVRDAAEYAFRFVVIPGLGPGTSTAVQLMPHFKPPPPPNYRTVVVDGGTMNNEPLELARIELAGLAGRNEREGVLANRATLMVDPFPDEADEVDDPERGQKDDLIGASIGLLNAWKDQARFAPLDLALATDKSVYSRFLIAPSRGDDVTSNGFDIACGALGGFSGFLSEKFRHHDFLLGRRNCQYFMRKHFCLPVGNVPVFGVVNPALKLPGSPWIVEGPEGPHLPIIPIMGAADPPVPLPAWPKGAMDPDALRKPVSKRLKLVLANVLRNSVQLNFFLRVIAEVGVMSIRRKAVDKLIQIIKDALKERNLN